MRQVASAAVILHNMIGEVRRGNYSSDGTAGRSRFFNEPDVSEEITFDTCSPGESLLSNCSATVSDDIKIKGMHRDLKLALIEHQWTKYGRLEV